jgi:cell division protein ZapD
VEQSTSSREAESLPLILYEYPFNESIRTMLRLEHLFDRLGLLIERDAAIDHHFALATIFEIMDVASRADLKSDLLKDLERHRTQLAQYRGNPSISEAALDQVIGRIETAFAALNQLPGKAGHALTTNEWLMGIRSRISIPGGTCEFDLPAYYAWQHETAARRQADLRRWLATLLPLAEALKVLLALLREAGSPQMVVAPGGQYQQSLPPGRSFSLIRVRIGLDAGLVPEISGHRLMVSIRWMRQDGEGRLRASPEDTGFELTLCS